MSASHRRTAVGAALAAAALMAAPSASVAAASASTPTIAPDQPCYVNAGHRAKVKVAGAGFTPGDAVLIQGTGFSATAKAGPAGTFVASAAAPKLAPGPASQKLQLKLTDQTTPSLTAATVIRVANLAVATSPTSVRNVRKDKVTYTFSGFTPGKRIFGFWLRRKLVATARFSKAQGPCGTLTERELLYPGGRPQNDQYRVAFESSSRYSTKAAPRVTGTLNILHF